MNIRINRDYGVLMLIGISIIASFVGNHLDASVLFAAAMIIATR